jgi:hypothetical protein
MPGSKALIAAVITAALTIGVLATPVSAASGGKLAIVQGMPGKKVDICINGKEIRSALPYGGKVLRSLKAGPKVLKVFKKDPRRCKGRLLARQRLTFPAGSDLTVVVTKKRPWKVLVWDNDGLGEVPVPQPIAFIAYRHSADLGTIQFKTDFKVLDPQPIEPFGPASDYDFEKGQQARGYTGAGADLLRVIWVTRPGSSEAIIGPVFTRFFPDKRHEWILVGTTERNARLVRIVRSVIPYTP